MVFSKAIKVKMMVNKFNRERMRDGFPVITFRCGMYSIGRWSADLKLERKGCFFSDEMKQISHLCVDDGLLFFVGCDDVSPKIYIQ